LDSTKKYEDLNLQTNKNITFHFLMALYVRNNLMSEFFNNLDNFIKSTLKWETNSSFIFSIEDKNDKNFRGQLGVKFNVLIKDSQDFLYAKNLNHLYSTEIKPFLNKNENLLKQLPEPFNRFYLLNGPTTSWMCGKTIHSTHSSVWVSTHYPEGNGFLNVLWTPQITDFKLDVNYFLCYYKPLIKKLYSKDVS